MADDAEVLFQPTLPYYLLLRCRRDRDRFHLDPSCLLQSLAETAGLGVWLIVKRFHDEGASGRRVLAFWETHLIRIVSINSDPPAHLTLATAWNVVSARCFGRGVT